MGGAGYKLMLFWGLRHRKVWEPELNKCNVMQLWKANRKGSGKRKCERDRREEKERSKSKNMWVLSGDNERKGSVLPTFSSILFFNT